VTLRRQAETSSCTSVSFAAASSRRTPTRWMSHHGACRKGVPGHRSGIRSHEAQVSRARRLRLFSKRDHHLWRGPGAGDRAGAWHRAVSPSLKVSIAELRLAGRGARLPLSSRSENPHQVWRRDNREGAGVAGPSSNTKPGSEVSW
jgi:hypothetical protein